MMDETGGWAHDAGRGSWVYREAADAPIKCEVTDEALDRTEQEFIDRWIERHHLPPLPRPWRPGASRP
jgi:hypothetical protein